MVMIVVIAMQLVTFFHPKWVALRSRQLCLVGHRQLLVPAVLEIGQRHYPMTPQVAEPQRLSELISTPLPTSMY